MGACCGGGGLTVARGAVLGRPPGRLLGGTGGRGLSGGLGAGARGGCLCGLLGGGVPGGTRTNCCEAGLLGRGRGGGAGLGGCLQPVLAAALEGHGGVAQRGQLGGHGRLVLVDLHSGGDRGVGLRLRGTAGLLRALGRGELLRLDPGRLPARAVGHDCRGRGALQGAVARGSDGLEGRRPVEQLLRALAAEEHLEVAEASTLLVDRRSVAAHRQAGAVGLLLCRVRTGPSRLGVPLLALELEPGAVPRLGRGCGAGPHLEEPRGGGGVAGVEGGHLRRDAGGRRPRGVDLLLRGVDRLGIRCRRHGGGDTEGGAQRRGEGQPQDAAGGAAARHDGPFSRWCQPVERRAGFSPQPHWSQENRRPKAFRRNDSSVVRESHECFSAGSGVAGRQAAQRLRIGHKSTAFSA